MNRRSTYLMWLRHMQYVTENLSCDLSGANHVAKNEEELVLRRMFYHNVLSN